MASRQLLEFRFSYIQIKSLISAGEHVVQCMMNIMWRAKKNTITQYHTMICNESSLDWNETVVPLDEEKNKTGYHLIEYSKRSNQ